MAFGEGSIAGEGSFYGNSTTLKKVTISGTGAIKGRAFYGIFFSLRSGSLVHCAGSIEDVAYSQLRSAVRSTATN